jgi:transcriptional regulator GlxA family with amidase domain
MDSQNKVQLLSAASATGSWVEVTKGGRYNFEATATNWNSASAVLERSPDAGTTSYSVDGTTLTANGGYGGIDLGAGHYRVAITGSPTAVTAALYGVN